MRNAVEHPNDFVVSAPVQFLLAPVADDLVAVAGALLPGHSEPVSKAVVRRGTEERLN